MRRQQLIGAPQAPLIKTTDQIVMNQRFTLLELLDRLLDKGVMVKGEILLSVADVDLVYLNLGLLLSSVKTVEKAARRGNNGETKLIPWQTSTQEELLDEPQREVGRKDVAPTPLTQANRQSVDLAAAKWVPPRAATTFHPSDGDDSLLVRTLPSAIDYGLDEIFEPKSNIDPENVEKGLAKLVLTLVDLIRKLMEKQALRRIEAEQLSAREIERVGNTFLLLDERMEQLKETFGLEDEDLNLDLGPLGELL